MKKLLVLILLISVGVTGWLLVDTNKTLESKLYQFTQKEISEAKKQEELNFYHNPEYIMGELRSVGKLLTYEGNITYKNDFKEKGWFKGREIVMVLNYSFGIGIDLDCIEIEDIYEKTVIINLPVDKIELEYMEYNPSVSDLVSDKKFFAKAYSPREIDNYIEIAKKSCLKEVEGDSYIRERSVTNTKKQIKDLIKSLGYEKVIFNEER